MQITSTAFQDGDPIPKKYADYGENINPPLTFSEVPVEAQSLALIVEDPDAPGGIFTHWILFDMPQGTLQIPEGQLPFEGIQGLNDHGTNDYFGPKPPSGTHRYFFKLFALDKILKVEDSSAVDRKRFYDEMGDSVIDTAEIIGTYDPKDN